MRSASERRGSSASDKQVQHAVKDRKMLVFCPLTGPSVEGWVYGVDDYHWLVITKDGRKFLVHKSCPSVEITDHVLFEGGTETNRIWQAVEPFRNYVLSHHFGQDTQRSAVS